MKYRELGNTGLKISEIGLGCEGFGNDNYRETRRLLDAAQEYGVNYIDLYTPDPGIRAAVGEALKGRRDQFYLQSHVCFCVEKRSVYAYTLHRGSESWYERNAGVASDRLY